MNEENFPVTAITFSNWNHLPDLHEVHDELSAEDRDCLNAISGVLAKFDRLTRFGVTLLHKHFDVASDEVLAEFVDEKGRRLEIKPVKVAEVAAALPGSYETSWSFSQGSAGQVYAVCLSRCFPGIPGSPSHVWKHLPG